MFLTTLDPLKPGEIRLQCLPDEGAHYVLVSVGVRHTSGMTLCRECHRSINVTVVAYGAPGE